MAYSNGECEEDVGLRVPFMNADEDGDEEESVPPVGPAEEEEYE